MVKPRNTKWHKLIRSSDQLSPQQQTDLLFIFDEVDEEIAKNKALEYLLDYRNDKKHNKENYK